VLALYDPDESFVVIDEPELSLHPQAQKRLARFISAQAAHRQIVLCSHSPHFINWADLAAGAAVYRLRQDRYGIHLHRLSDNTIAMLNKLVDDWQKPQLLDTVAREVFFR
jgi:predicted ATP-dependent endonuclease of OLD family